MLDGVGDGDDVLHSSRGAEFEHGENLFDSFTNVVSGVSTVTNHGAFVRAVLADSCDGIDADIADIVIAVIAGDFD
jgi:hypothetical protein